MILITSVPRTDPSKPLAGPAYLKGYLSENDIQSTVTDWNYDLYRHCQDNNLNDDYWSNNNLTSEDDKFESIWVQTEEWNINYFTDKLKGVEWLGLSLLRFQSNVAAEILLVMIRKHFPDIKIVIGGTEANNIGEDLLQRNLIDFYIGGDGEEALYSLLTGDYMHPGINNYHISPTSLDAMPFALYDDLDMNNYQSMYIMTSKGCVRNCTFCNINAFWSKYKFKSPEVIVKEIEFYHKHFNKTIIFADSLMNALPPKFRAMLRGLIELDMDIHLSGQIIIRDPKQMPEGDYYLLKKAGFNTLTPGIESGSEKVRSDMKKPFTDADLLFYLRMTGKYKIKSTILMIVGYITETEMDFQATLALMFILLTEFKGQLNYISYGEQMFLLPGTPLYNNPELFDVFDYSDWEANGLTPAIRQDRLRRLNEYITSLNGSNKSRKTAKHNIKDIT